MAKGRDRYGRFRGKGGIKPYKSNLQGAKKNTRGKRLSGRNKAILGVAATATVVGVAYANRRGIARVTGTETKVAGKLMNDARARRPARATPLIQLKSPNKTNGSSIKPTPVKPKRDNLARADAIVQRNNIRRNSTLTGVLAGKAARSVSRI